ncbi:MAG: metallophosphoesterase family protein [Campylobacterota bacterium]|nr:metallophosphoesterase family protein [Campylobacterota bacterium]
MEQLSLPSPSIIEIEKFTKENIKKLEQFFDKNSSATFIQKMIDDVVKFDTDAMIYMMQVCSQKRANQNIITLKEDAKEYFVVGDIHADSVSLNKILNKTEFYDNYEDKRVVFLGDYIDRGKNRLSVINLLITLEFLIPDNITILKGNHELFLKDEDDKIQSIMQGRESLSYFFTFLNMLSSNPQYKNIFTSEFIEAYAEYFEKLPILALLDFKDIKIMAVHGGIPRADLLTNDYYDNFNSLDDFFVDDKKDNIGMSLKNNFLWSDPYDENEIGFRNTSLTRFQFNKNQFVSFCKKFNIDIILRAHESQDDGYKTYFDNRLISVFSTGGQDVEGNINQNSHYNSVTPNILKVDFKNKVIESYEILFSDGYMICEEKFNFKDIIKQKNIDEQKYISYLSINSNHIIHEKKKIENYKLLKITDKYNRYVMLSLTITQDNIINLNYSLLKDFYGIHHKFDISIDCKENKIINNSDISIYADRFELSSSDSIPYSDGSYIVKSGGCLNFELVG